jgi:membrane fusion protein (multidrug efflux system)
MREALVRKTRIVALGAVALVAVGCEEKPQAPPPPEVYVAEVTQKDVPIYMELVGQAQGSQDVQIRARVEGYLNSVDYTEGTFVEKGALLYRIDPQPFEAALARAKGELATAQASLVKHNNDVVRLTPLAASQAVSQQELDDALSARDAARAQVAAQQASVESATLNLGYCTITAPLEGLAGTSNVKAGNLVGRGESTLLTTISQIDPILFNAGISETDYLRLARRRDEMRASRGGEPPSIELILADGTILPHTGSLDAIERQVDPTTGTLTVRTRFANPEKLVRPGQYGRIRFISEVEKNALLVPQKAVAEMQNLYSVGVLGADNKVTLRTVKVGPRVDSLWVITDGLKPGEKIVVEGLQRVKDGAVVTPKTVEASPTAPTPAAAPADAAKAH